MECPRQGGANDVVIGGADVGALGMSTARGDPKPGWPVVGDTETPQVMPPAIAESMPVQRLEFWSLVEGSAAVGRRMGLRLARGLRPSWIGSTTR